LKRKKSHTGNKGVGGCGFLVFKGQTKEAGLINQKDKGVPQNKKPQMRGRETQKKLGGGGWGGVFWCKKKKKKCGRGKKGQNLFFCPLGGGKTKGGVHPEKKTAGK